MTAKYQSWQLSKRHRVEPIGRKQACQILRKWRKEPCCSVRRIGLHAYALDFPDLKSEWCLTLSPTLRIRTYPEERPHYE